MKIQRHHNSQQIPCSASEWREKEREADADIKAGRVSGPFDNVDDLLKALKKGSKVRRTGSHDVEKKP